MASATHGDTAADRAAVGGIVGMFLLLQVLSTPFYVADTLRFATDAVGFSNGAPAQFWEFGHLLWRPLGYVGLQTAGPLFQSYWGDTPVQAVARWLTGLSFAAALGSLPLLYRLLRRIARPWTAAAGAAVVVTAGSFWNYSQAGAPYVPAFFFLVLALWALDRALHSVGPGRWAIAAGAAFALSLSLWFPYAFAGLGLLAFVALWNREPSAGGAGRIRGVAGPFLLAATALTGALFGAGAAAHGVRSLAGFLQWALEADNGWAQNLTAVRIATGLPRSLYALVDDTIPLKRYFFKDPYNPASLWDILAGLGFRLAAFYLAAAGLLLLLTAKRTLRPALGIFLSAITPFVFFAVVLFEPSSPERFLPTLPFLAGAVTAALTQHARPWRLALLAAVVLCPLAANLPVFADPEIGRRRAATQARIQALEQHISAPALVVVLTFRDDLYYLPLIRPLDHELTPRRLEITDAVEIGSQRLLRWRQEFAEQALKAWIQGREVWISERLLADAPRPEWKWVEGDSPLIRWPELPEFFRQWATGPAVLAGQDGFRQVLLDYDTRARLRVLFMGSTSAPEPQE
jgi:hypothetical protein